LLPPCLLDVEQPSHWPEARFDALVCINLVHISPWTTTCTLLTRATEHLVSGGTLVLYGPYNIEGRYTSEGNRSFDASLRARNPSWGLRDMVQVKDEAQRHGLLWQEHVEMPANNLSLILRTP